MAENKKAKFPLAKNEERKKVSAKSKAEVKKHFVVTNKK